MNKEKVVFESDPEIFAFEFDATLEMVLALTFAFEKN